MELNVDDAMYLQLPGQMLYKQRYLARPYPGLGVCVYTIPAYDESRRILRVDTGPWPWQCQLFPNDGGDLKLGYVSYVVGLANRLEADARPLRQLYPFFVADDLLTLKAKIIDAAERWKEHRQHGI